MTGSDGAPGSASADWAGETSRRWAAQAGRLEAMLAPVDDILLRAAAIADGERVLDVGCGRGVTTRSVAAITGPGGTVTGLDISPTLVAEADRFPPSPSSAPIDWIAADAAAYPFPPDAFDAVVSRFGIMFFDDPVAAFANLRSGVRSDGNASRHFPAWRSNRRGVNTEIAANTADGTTRRVALSVSRCSR